MKIYVNEISEEGIALSEKIDQTRLLSNTETVDFVGAINVEANVTKTGREIFINVLLDVPVEYTCARCLFRKPDIMRKEFDIIQEARPDEVIEIDEDIRQEVILNLPMKIVCRPDCKGLCPNCGQNLNISECECNKEV